MTNSPATKPLGRSDVITIVAVVALVAIVFLIPASRGFVLTNFDIVLGAIFDAGRAVGHAARFVASLFGSAA